LPCSSPYTWSLYLLLLLIALLFAVHVVTLPAAAADCLALRRTRGHFTCCCC